MINRKLKRIVSTILIFCMVLSCMPQKAQGISVAESEINGIDGSAFDFEQCTKEQKLSVLRQLIYEISEGETDLRDESAEEYGARFDFSSMTAEQKKDKAIDILKTIDDIGVDIDRVLANNEKHEASKSTAGSPEDAYDYDAIRKSIIDTLTEVESDTVDSLTAADIDMAENGDLKVDGDEFESPYFSGEAKGSLRQTTAAGTYGPRFALYTDTDSDTYPAVAETTESKFIVGYVPRDSVTPVKGILNMKIVRSDDTSGTQRVYFRVFQGTISESAFIPQIVNADGTSGNGYVIFGPDETEKKIYVSYDLSGDDVTKGYFGNGYMYGNSSYNDVFSVEIYKVTDGDGTGLSADAACVEDKSSVTVILPTNDDRYLTDLKTGNFNGRNAYVWDLNRTNISVTKGQTFTYTLEIPQWLRDMAGERDGILQLGYKDDYCIYGSYGSGSAGGVPQKVTAEVIDDSGSAYDIVLKSIGGNYHIADIANPGRVKSIRYTVTFSEAGNSAVVYSETYLSIVDNTAPVLNNINIEGYDGTEVNAGKARATLEFNEPVTVYGAWSGNGPLPYDYMHPIFAIPAKINGDDSFINMRCIPIPDDKSYFSPGASVICESIEPLKPGTVIEPSAIGPGNVYLLNGSGNVYITGINSNKKYAPIKTYTPPAIESISAEPGEITFENRNEPLSVNITGTGFLNPVSNLQIGPTGGPFCDVTAISDTEGCGKIILPPNTSDKDSSVYLYSYVDYSKEKYLSVKRIPRVPVDSLAVRDINGQDVGQTVEMYVGSTLKLLAAADVKSGTTLPPSFPGALWSADNGSLTAITVGGADGSECIITALAEGTVVITAKSTDLQFLEDNGVTPTKDQKERCQKTFTINITQNPNPPGIDVDKSLDTVYTISGSDGAVFWGSSVHSPDRVYNVKLIEYKPDAEYPPDGSSDILWQSSVTGSLSMAVPASQLTKLSEVVGNNYVPAYTAYISSLQEGTGLLMKGRVNIVVKPKPAKVNIEGETGYVIYGESSVEPVGFSIENETVQTKRKAVLRQNGEEIKVFQHEDITGNQISVPVDKKPTDVKDMYTLTVMADNGSGWATDTYIYYVYNPDSFNALIDEKLIAGTTISMSNREKLRGKTEDEIASMVQDLPLLKHAAVKRGNWGGDTFTWESSDSSALSLQMPAGGYLPAPTSALKAYRSDAQVSLVGVNDGSSTVTVTHVNTGKQFAFDVNVESVKGRLYLFKSVAEPVERLTISYVDGQGKGKIREYGSRDFIAIYDEDGINSDIHFTGVDPAKDADSEDVSYTGFIRKESLLTGEGSGLNKGEDPYAVNRYRLFPLTNISLKLVNDHYRNATGKFYVNSMVVAGDTVYAHSEASGRTVVVKSDGILTPEAVDLSSISSDVLTGAGQVRFCYEIIPADDDTRAKYAPVYTEIARNIDEDFGKIDASVRIRGKQSVQAYSYDQSLRATGNKFWRDASVRTDPLYLVGDTRSYDMMARVNWLGQNQGSVRLFNSREEDVTKEANLQLRLISYRDTTGQPFTNLSSEYSQVTFEITDDMIVPSSKDSIYKEIYTIKVYGSDGSMLHSQALPFAVVNYTNFAVIGVKEQEDLKDIKLDFTGTIDSGVFDSNVAGMNNMDIKLPVDLPIEFSVEMDEDDPFSGTFTGTIGANKGSDLYSKGPYKKEEFEKKANELNELRENKGKKKEGEKDWDLSISGYVEGDVKYVIPEDGGDPGWKMLPTGGGLIVEASISYKYTVNTIVVFVPVYYGIEVGGSLSLDFNISKAKVPESWENEDESKLPNNGGLACDFKFTVILAGYFKASAGIGFDISIIAFKIGVYGQIDLAVANSTLKSYYQQQRYVVDSSGHGSLKDYSLSNGTKLNLKLGAGIEVMFKFLFLVFKDTLADASIEWEWHWDHKGYCTFGNKPGLNGGGHRPNPTGGLPAGGYSADMVPHITGMRMVEGTGRTESVSSVSLEGREYMDAPQIWAGGNYRERSVAGRDPVIWENSYPFAYPFITSDGQMTAMLYDNKSRDINDTKAAFTIKGETGWSEPQIIDKDLTPDSNMTMQGTSEFAVAAWEDMREKIDTEALRTKAEQGELDNTDIVRMMNNSEIKAAVYDGTQWTAAAITDDYRSDMAPKVATDGRKNAIVVWQKVASNNADNPLDMGGGNEVWYSIYDKISKKWSTERLLDAGDSGDTKSISAAMASDGRAMVLLGVDSGSGSSLSGREVYSYIIGSDGNPCEKTRLTDNDFTDTNPQVTVINLNGEENFLSGWYTKTPVYGDVPVYDTVSPENPGDVPHQPVRDENGNAVTERGVIYERDDIQLYAVTTDGRFNSSFPDSIAEINNAKDVTITENFRLLQGTGQNPSDFGIAWVGTEKTLIPGEDNARDQYVQNQNISAARFVTDSETGDIRVSAPVVITSLQGDSLQVAGSSNEVLDCFDACMVPAGDGSVNFSTVYAKTAYTYTEKDINAAFTDAMEGNASLLTPTPVSSVCQASVILKDEVEIWDASFNSYDVYQGGNLNIAVRLFNKGTKDIESFDFTIEGETYHVDKVLRPNDETEITIEHKVNKLANTKMNLTANFAGNTKAAAEYDLNFGITDIGITECRTVKAGEGRRIIEVKLENQSSLPLSESGCKVELRAYEDMQRKTEVPIALTDDAIYTLAQAAPVPVVIDGNGELSLIDKGMSTIFVEYDASLDLKDDGKYLYFYARVVDAEGNFMGESLYGNNNGAVYMENPQKLHDSQFDINVYRLTDGSTDVTVRNNYMKAVENAYLTAKLYDANGEEKETVSRLLTLGPEGEITENIAFSTGGAEVRAYVSEVPPVTEFALVTSPAAIGRVNESTKKISIVAPYGTDLKNVAATFRLAGQEGTGNTGTTVTIGGINQVSGSTVNDFSEEVIYRIEKSGEAVEYTVKVVEETADDNTALSSLSYCINGGEATAIGDFAPDKTAYFVALPGKTPKDAKISLVAAPASTKAAITANEGVVLQEGRGQATVEIRAQNSATDKYTVDFSVNNVYITVEDTVHVYDGTAKGISVKTTPSGIAYDIAYTKDSQNVDAPVDAGTYGYEVTVDDRSYSGVAAGTLTIKKAEQQRPEGEVKAEVTTNRIDVTSHTGDQYEYSMDGVNYVSSGIFTGLQSDTIYKVYVRLRGDDNHNPSESVWQVFTTEKLPPDIVNVEIAVSGEVQVYDGSPKGVATVTSPSGIKCTIDYRQNGMNVENPTDAGTYGYTVTVSQEGYSGNATGTLTIKKAEQQRPEGEIKAEVTADRIAVTSHTEDQYEYSMDGVNYVSSGIFTGLQSDTLYRVYVRLRGDDNHNPSEPVWQVFTTSKQSTGSSGNSSGSQATISADAIRTEKEDSLNNVHTTITLGGSDITGGVIKGTVSDKTMAEAIRQSVNAGRDMESPSAEIEIRLGESAEKAENLYKASIIVSRFSLMQIGNSTAASLKTTTPLGQIVFDNRLLKQLSDEISNNFTITIETDEAEGTLYCSFSIEDDGQKRYNLEGTQARIRIPYELKPGEDADSITMIYIGADDQLHTLKTCRYDETEGMIEADIRHLTKFTTVSGKPNFADSNMWAEDDISFVAARGIMNGTGENRFDPDDNVSRAMFVTALYRLAETQYEGEGEYFRDVDEDSWYSAAVDWAFENDILKGTGHMEFSPDKDITREQMAVIAANFFRYMGKNLEEETSLEFGDDNLISSYAADSVKAVSSAGIMKGKEDNIFDPAGKAVRAEMAATLKRIVIALMK